MSLIVDRNSPEWKEAERENRERFEKMAAEILNQSFEESKSMNQDINRASEEIHCISCTARKFVGWKHCPFCGAAGHYYNLPDGQKIHGSGVVRILVNECSEGTQGVEEPNNIHGLAQTQGMQQRFAHSSEKDQFNGALKIVGDAFGKLERVRKSRDQAEIELKTAIQKIEKLQAQLPQGMKDCTIITEECDAGHTSMRGTNWIKHDCFICEIGRLNRRIEGLERELELSLKAAQRNRPEPVAVRNVFGKMDGRDYLETLGIVKLDQCGTVCDVTVRLPR